MQRPSPFAYSRTSQYVLAVREGLPRGVRSWSRWSARLGYRSPRGLAMVASGQRLPSDEMLRRLGRFLKLTKEEERWLRTLVDREEAARYGQPTDAWDKALDEMHPRALRSGNVAPEALPVLCHWQNLVLKQLVVAGAPLSPETIARRLDHAVTPEEVRSGLAALEKHGFLRRLPDGRFRPGSPPVRTTPEVGGSAVRRLHREMAFRALASLRRDPPEEREFSSLTLRFDRAAMPEAKEVVRRFVKEFNDRFSRESASEVFQLNVQLFPHTVRS